MKIVKYLALIAFGLALVATVAHFQRESIVRNLTNSALSGKGFTATEVSVETLDANQLVLAHLSLEQDDGTRYDISNLSFPLSFPSIRPESILIDQVVMTSVPSSTTRLPLFEMLRSLLLLPVDLPNTEIAVGGFTMSETPTLKNIVWRSTDRQQNLEFNVESVDIKFIVESIGDDHHQVTINAVVGGLHDALSSTLDVRRVESGFSIDGIASTDFTAFWQTLQSAGFSDSDISSLAGSANGKLKIDLYDSEVRPDTVSAQLTMADGLIIDTTANGDTPIRVRLDTTSTLQIDVEYPLFEWTAEIAQLDIEFAVEPVRDILIRLSDIECSSTLQCEFHAESQSGPIELDSIAIGNTRFSATISTKIDDSGWHIDSDRIELALDTLKDRDSIVASTIVVINDFQLRDSGMSVDADVSLLPGATYLSWRDNALMALYSNGKVALQEHELSASFVVHDGRNAFSANLQATHNLSTGKGSLLLDNAALLLDRSALSARMRDWPYDWDIVSGSVSTEIVLNWGGIDVDAVYDGSMSLRVDALAGNYGDIVFSGLSATMSGSVDSVTGIAMEPSFSTLDLLDIGVPVQDIGADFAVNVSKKTVLVEKISMSALGGELVTDTFVFDMNSDENNIMLRPKSIQLQFMVDLAEFDDIEMSGSISGSIPMSINSDKVTITDGRLESDPPGGVIRYSAGDAEDGAAVSDLGLVTRALANFQFDSLTSDVNYTENGDLKLQMKLTGINPDMDDRQPVILNLGVENNIPQLLRSLQATRTIEDILERKSAN